MIVLASTTKVRRFIELMPLVSNGSRKCVGKLFATTGDETGRVLELPTGIRDGTSSLGNFGARSQYFRLFVDLSTTV